MTISMYSCLQLILAEAEKQGLKIDRKNFMRIRFSLRNMCNFSSRPTIKVIDVLEPMPSVGELYAAGFGGLIESIWLLRVLIIWATGLLD